MQGIRGPAIRGHMRFLSASLLQGRAPGTMAVFRISPLFPLPIELGSTEVEANQRIHNVSAVDLTSVYYALGGDPDGGGTLSIMRASKLW